MDTFIVKNMELSFYGQKDGRSECKIQSLKWTFNYVASSSGISYMTISVPDQEIIAQYSLYNKDTDSYESKEETIQINNVKVVMGVHKLSDDLRPQYCNYDVRTKELEVFFNNNVSEV